MSDTPRTEQLAQMCSTDGEYSDVQAYNLMYSHALNLERELAAANERARTDREALANLMLRHALATGHGDTIADLLRELDWQLAERDRDSALTAQQAGEAVAVIDTCDLGHRFAKLPDHPKNNGMARCPHCMALGLDLLRHSSTQEFQRGMLRAAEICDEQERLHQSTDQKAAIRFVGYAITRAAEQEQVNAEGPFDDNAEFAALMKFYGVSDYRGLIRMQCHHIEKLQAKLPPPRDTEPRNYRKG